MFVRIASFKLRPDAAPAAIVAYEAQGVPRVKATAGNVDCYLLQPVAPADVYLACTLWASEAAAKAYETSGAAQEVAGLLRPAFDGPPELRTYRTTEQGPG